MAPMKKKPTLRTMETRSASSSTNLPNINLPECARKILNKDLVIKILPITAENKTGKTMRKVNSLSSVSKSSMTVKINSGPHIIRTYSKLAAEQKLNEQPSFASAGKNTVDSCSTLKENCGCPSPISKPRGATLNSANLSPSKSRKSAKLSRVKDDIKQLVKSSPALPSKTEGRPILPVVQLSKLSDFKIFDKSKQIIVCSQNTSSQHIDLLRNRIFHANLPPNSKLSIVRQSPQPELSVIHVSKMPSTLPNIGSLPQQLTLSSLMQLAVGKPGSTNRSQTCLSTESEKLVTNKLNPQLSIIRIQSVQEQPSSSVLKMNNNPILRERMNVETNSAKKSEVCNTVELSQEEIVVLPSNEPSPADGHLSGKETVKVSVKNDRRRRISTKQPQTKEKSAKMAKLNDENVVPVQTDLQVEVINLEPLEYNSRASKRLRYVKQPDFSSVLPEAKKVKRNPTSDTSIAISVGVQNLKTKMSVKRCRNRALEMDSLDSGFQMLDIDIFFPSNEFEIPDMDILMQNLFEDV